MIYPEIPAFFALSLNRTCVISAILAPFPAQVFTAEVVKAGHIHCGDTLRFVE
jgi:hypothetical protein